MSCRMPGTNTLLSFQQINQSSLNFDGLCLCKQQKGYLQKFFFKRLTKFQVLMIYEMNHMWTSEMKWKEEVIVANPFEVLEFFQASLRNCINCVNCDDHFVSFHFRSHIWFISAVTYDSFHISLTLISLTGTYEPTIDLLPTSVAS